MNQNPSPNLAAGASGNADFTQRHDDNESGINPYYTTSRHNELPDLDANAPFLKSGEAQRLNRRALFFLAGIIGLLMLMTALMLRSATSGNDAAARPREETVVIPELPRGPATSANSEPLAEPIGLAAPSPPAAQHLPPLPPPGAAVPPPLPSDFALAAPPVPSLAERRMGSDGGAAEAGLPPPDAYARAMLAGLQASPPGNPGVARAAPAAPASNAQFLGNPDALLLRGTYIRCVLETRIVTDIPGFTSCVVTEPVYSVNGRRLLIQKGSKIFGKYDNGDPPAARVSVIWDRITTPGGMVVSMSSPGVDNLGGAGHPGDYDAHWLGRMSAALMISLVSDAFKYAGATYGPESAAIADGVVVQSPFESNTARTVERLANHALDRGIDRPATVTINQGVIVNVYVAKDIDFSGVLPRDH